MADRDQRERQSGNAQTFAVALPVLTCPDCGDGFELQGRTVRCGNGHAFDLARQGYLNLLTGKADSHVADTAAMVAARERFLSGRHYGPIADAVAAAAGYAQTAAAGIAVELAAGTGYYLARLADAQPSAIGIAMDIARPALQRAARCHPRVVAVGWDVWRPLPIADRSVAVVLSVFGPRNALEIKRILRPGGAIVIVTPLPEHLNQLRDPLGLVGIDPLKPSRLSASFDPVAQLESEVRCEYSIMLSRTDCLALAEMGPSAHHSTPAQLAERTDRLDELTEVSVAVRVSTYRV